MTEPAYRYRKLLTCNLENLSNRQTEKLKVVLASDTELGIISAIKEHVRDLLKTTNIDDFQRRLAIVERSVSQGFEVAGGKVTVRDVEDVAEGASGVLSDEADQRPQRGREPHGEEHEKDRAWVYKSRELSAQDIVVHGGPPAVLNTHTTPKVEEPHYA